MWKIKKQFRLRTLIATAISSGIYLGINVLPRIIINESGYKKMHYGWPLPIAERWIMFPKMPAEMEFLKWDYMALGINVFVYFIIICLVFLMSEIVMKRQSDK
jgi:hypothetical protein